MNKGGGTKKKKKKKNKAEAQGRSLLRKARRKEGVKKLKERQDMK